MNKSTSTNSILAPTATPSPIPTATVTPTVIRSGSESQSQPNIRVPGNALEIQFFRRFHVILDASLGDASISEIDEAITAQEKDVRLTPDDHPDKVPRLNTLGELLLCRFEHSQDLADIEKAIAAHEDAVRLAPDGHPDKAACLDNLGNSLVCRFKRSRYIADIHKAISAHEDAVRLTPDSHSDKASRLCNLRDAKRARMRDVFAICMQAVMECTDPAGRKRCDLFKELPIRKHYPDYFQMIMSPIAISTIRKRSSGSYYKTVTQYLDDWRLMFNNARIYNQEGSRVYVDAGEMQKALESTFREQTVGSGLPGADAGDGISSGLASLTSHEAAGSPQHDDDVPRAPKISKGSRIGKLVQSDESYYSGGSDDD